MTVAPTLTSGNVTCYITLTMSHNIMLTWHMDN